MYLIFLRDCSYLSLFFRFYINGIYIKNKKYIFFRQIFLVRVTLHNNFLSFIYLINLIRVYFYYDLIKQK